MKKQEILKKESSEFLKFKKSIEEFPEELSKEFFVLFISSFNIIECLGMMAISMGKLQKSNEEAYEYFTQQAEQPEQFISMMIEQEPPENIVQIFDDCKELLEGLKKFEEFKELNADEKIEFGKKTLELTSRIKNMIKKETKKGKK